MKEKVYEFEVNDKQHNKRLDVFISEMNSDISRSSLKSREAVILVNQDIRKLSYKVKKGDHIQVVLPPPEIFNLIPQDIPFDELYADDHIAIINKPAGIPTHPSKGHPDHTLVNGLLFRYGNQLSADNGSERPGIVHRLDMDTSGIMIIALSERSHRKLTEDFKYRRINKMYQTLVKGHPPQSGKIDLPIGRHPSNRKKMTVITDHHYTSKSALTEWKVIEYFPYHSLVKVFLHTGRTHQIRVHFSHMKHPLVGDTIYSRNANQYPIKKLALIAKRLEFEHPISGKRMEFEVQLPDHFQKLIDYVKNLK